MRRGPVGIGERSRGKTLKLYKIDDDESEQEKKLRPLRGVAHECLDVLDHDRADVPGKEARQPVQKSVEPAKIAPTLTRFLRLGPAIEIDYAGDP